MTLRLTVATHEWHEAQRRLQEQVPGLVPVAKGNGYGFGLDVLAREATRMRAGVLAVGTAHEVTTVRLAGWRGDVVVSWIDEPSARMTRCGNCATGRGSGAARASGLARVA